MASAEKSAQKQSALLDHVSAMNQRILESAALPADREPEAGREMLRLLYNRAELIEDDLIPACIDKLGPHRDLPGAIEVLRGMQLRPATYCVLYFVLYYSEQQLRVPPSERDPDPLVEVLEAFAEIDTESYLAIDGKHKLVLFEAVINTMRAFVGRDDLAELDALRAFGDRYELKLLNRLEDTQGIDVAAIRDSEWFIAIVRRKAVRLLHEFNMDPQEAEEVTKGLFLERLTDRELSDFLFRNFVWQEKVREAGRFLYFLLPENSFAPVQKTVERYLINTRKAFWDKQDQLAENDQPDAFLAVLNEIRKEDPPDPESLGRLAEISWNLAVTGTTDAAVEALVAAETRLRMIREKGIDTPSLELLVLLYRAILYCAESERAAAVKEEVDLALARHVAEEAAKGEKKSMALERARKLTPAETEGRSLIPVSLYRFVIITLHDPFEYLPWMKQPKRIDYPSAGFNILARILETVKAMIEHYGKDDDDKLVSTRVYIGGPLWKLTKTNGILTPSALVEMRKKPFASGYVEKDESEALESPETEDPPDDFVRALKVFRDGNLERFTTAYVNATLSHCSEKLANADSFAGREIMALWIGGKKEAALRKRRTYPPFDCARELLEAGYNDAVELVDDYAKVDSSFECALFEVAAGRYENALARLKDWKDEVYKESHIILFLPGHILDSLFRYAKTPKLADALFELVKLVPYVALCDGHLAAEELAMSVTPSLILAGRNDLLDYTFHFLDEDEDPAGDYMDWMMSSAAAAWEVRPGGPAESTRVDKYLAYCKRAVVSWPGTWALRRTVLDFIGRRHPDKLITELQSLPPPEESTNQDHRTIDEGLIHREFLLGGERARLRIRLGDYEAVKPIIQDLPWDKATEYIGKSRISIGQLLPNLGAGSVSPSVLVSRIDFARTMEGLAEKTWHHWGTLYPGPCGEALGNLLGKWCRNLMPIDPAVKPILRRLVSYPGVLDVAWTEIYDVLRLFEIADSSLDTVRNGGLK